MIAKQISVFLENKNGHLADVTEILSDRNINISALSVADTKDYGMIRMILDQPEQAVSVLKENGISAHLTDVINIRIPDVPGALHKILKYLSQAEISVSYMYGYSNNQIAHMIIRVDNVNKAEELLKEHHIQ